MKTYGAVDLAGLTGATATTRWVGGTTAGPPTTGTFAVGDWVVDQAGKKWVCTSAGSPGTWIMTGASLSTTLAGLPGASAANAGQIAYLTDLTQWVRSDGSSWVTTTGAVGLGVAAKGDIVVASGPAVVYRLPVSATAGSLIMPSTGAATGLAWTANPYMGSVRPTGALAETFPRMSGAMVNTLAAPVSGTMRIVAIWLPTDLVVTSISIAIGGTALATGTHGWAALFVLTGGALLRQSADDTTPTAAANTIVTFTLSSTFTTTFSGNYYLGFLWTASTMPTLTGLVSRASVNASPSISATSTTGLTTTAPANAGAPTTLADIPYAYVS